MKEGKACATLDRYFLSCIILFCHLIAEILLHWNITSKPDSAFSGTRGHSTSLVGEIIKDTHEQPVGWLKTLDNSIF